MHSFRDRFFRFMEGRYGLRGLQDGLQIVIYAVYLILVIINFLPVRELSTVLSYC